MRILTAASARRAPFDCETWCRIPASVSRAEVEQGGYVHDAYDVAFTGDFERAVAALLNYRVFPPHRMRAQVCMSDGVVRLGATIVQRVVLGPIAIEAGVRVVEFDRTADAVSYAYATLAGHTERGIASFAVARAGQRVRFEAQAWSRAGHWLTTIGRPIARAIQRALTREAMDYFRRAAD